MYLESHPLNKNMRSFIYAIQDLDADCDVVNKVKREYLGTYMLYPVYRKCFGKFALADNSITYRLKQLNPLDYEDDLMVVEQFGKHWQPKYFINRLNRPLLRIIYLPELRPDWRHISQLTISLHHDTQVWLDSQVVDSEEWE